jgi:hypothetical protein
MSKNEGGNLVVVAGSKTVPLPDFDCLLPVPTVRLDWFERQAKEFGIDDICAEEWRRANDDKKIASLQPWFVGGPSTARHAQCHAILYPHRDPHGDCFIAHRLPRAPALRTRTIEDSATAGAVRAGRDLPQGNSLLALAAHELPAATAFVAGSRFCADLGP